MYTVDTYKKPFWAENSGFMTGRDPLGIQNSSIATYGKLLPGMTNLTLRLRYYGFYLWLLYEYDKKEKAYEENKLVYHYKFIRRAELIIAYLMTNKFSEEQSIVGSDYANRNKNTVDTLGYYEIDKGADKLKTTSKGSVYWDYTSGALGQYYAGTLVNLNLIKTSNGFFIIQDEGMRLAKAFEKSIQVNTRQLMLTCIESGKLTADQVNKLVEFAINDITKESEEWKLYNEILLSKDGEDFKNAKGEVTTFRRETIKYYLNFINEYTEKKYEKEFLKSQYKINLIKTNDDASFGWYYFYINEIFHYSIEKIFWALLDYLDGKIVNVKEFIDNICKDIIGESKSVFVTDETHTIDHILKETKNFNLLDDLEKLIKSKDIGSIAMSFRLIFQLYLENKENLPKITEFENLNLLMDKKGRVTENVTNFISMHLNSKFNDYVKSSIKNILNDHVSTAYRKMGNGESNLLKFIIEDNNIIHIQTMEPKFTSPRLRTIHNFLKDLGFLDKKSKLSNDGIILLKDLTNN